MPEKLIPAKQDIEDDFCATLGEQSLVHDMSRQHNDPTRSDTNSHPLQQLEPSRPLQKDYEGHKMKILVLSLLLGLVCDAQEADDQKGLSQLSGKWRTVYIASTSPEKIAENGPFRAYLCYLVFDDEQGTVDFYFYVKLNGEWVAKHVTGEKQENNTYLVKYEGENEFEVIYASDTILVISVVNKDKNRKCGEIQLAGIFVKVNDIEEKALEIFKELLKLKGIEEKHIVDFFKSGN
ncbi:odorant-binding protein-like [Cervus canadensis]|uniref:odorant-binding protein-like n=1 Tax=Cervus canadensis TaxID=1574408 RepID=UPI001C9E76D1|nr:odorant-binding protein-like [Cervus canadensis]